MARNKAARWPRMADRGANEHHGLERAKAEGGQIAEEAIEYVRNYVRSNPESAALWALGIGFVLGWKLKPW